MSITQALISRDIASCLILSRDGQSNNISDCENLDKMSSIVFSSDFSYDKRPATFAKQKPLIESFHLSWLIKMVAELEAMLG